MDPFHKTVNVITAPAYEPVTLTEAKLWCRIEDDDTEQDAMLLLLIIAMREYAEALTGRSFVQRTLELRLDKFPDGTGGDAAIALPFGPLCSVTSVSYIDGEGTLQTLTGSPSAFQEDLSSEVGRVAPLSGTSWPPALAQLGAVRVRYVAGYATVNSIPKLLRLWTQARIGTLFDNREQLTQSNIFSIPRDFVDGLLDDLRLRTMFA